MFIGYLHFPLWIVFAYFSFSFFFAYFSFLNYEIIKDYHLIVQNLNDTQL